MKQGTFNTRMNNGPGQNNNNRNIGTRVIPGMGEEKAWALANRIDKEGAAEVWCGPLEQAELYHQQLAAEGLTMAPIERT